MNAELVREIRKKKVRIPHVTATGKTSKEKMRLIGKKNTRHSLWMRYLEIIISILGCFLFLIYVLLFT